MDKILIVDDNPAVCDAITLLMSLHDIEGVACHSPAEALERLTAGDINLVIQDMNFSADTTSGEEGEELFKKIRITNPDLPIILLTAWTHLETAVALVRAGAADYLGKPWDDNKLVVSVKNLLEMHELRSENQRLQRKRKNSRRNLERYNLCGLVFDSPAMERLLEVTTQIADSDVPVLITGPNGAGKEKIAEIIQANSQRHGKPFIKVNAGALPRDLMEAELFGAEAGAFTGASKTRIGRFEAADGGTLFLDEIGNLPLSGQIKLLRVLQTGEFERLGSHQTLKTNVRIVSATNASLEDAIKSGDFRQDLYYRLNVIELKIPPLSQRREDILPLIEHFIDKQKSLSEDAKTILTQHQWPGNVRELENATKRALLLSQTDELTTTDFGIEFTKPSISTHTEYSKEELIQALNENDGVIAKAANNLGLSRQAFYRRLEKHGIKR